MAAAPKSLLSMRSVQRLCREKESLERKFLPINPNYQSNSYYKIGTVLLREKYPQEVSNSTRSAKVLIVYISVILTTVIFIVIMNFTGPPVKQRCPVRGKGRNPHFLSLLSHSDAVKKVEGVRV